MRGILAGPWGVRLALLALGLGSLGGYALGVPLVAGRGARTHEAYVVLHLALFAAYLAAVVLILRGGPAGRATVGSVLAFGLLFRLVVVPSPVFLSSDVYRYLWDGRVQRSGLSPYRHPPAAEELRALRDPEIWPHINRPAQPTVYPPGAQLVYALVTRLAPDSIPGWRLFVLGCEALTTGLLLGLLRRMRQPPSAVVVYAWAPLAVFESVQAGHVDFVMLPLLLVALGWRQEGHVVRAGVALGAATLVKLYPAVLLVAWHRRGAWRLPAAWAATMALGYLVFLGAVGSRVMGFLPRYFGSAEDFNIGLRQFLTELVGLGLGDPVRRALGELVLALLRRLGRLDPQLSAEALLSSEEAAALRRAFGQPAGDVGSLLLLQLGNELIRGVTMAGLFLVLALVLVRIGRRRGAGPAGILDAGLAAAGAYLVLVPTAMHAWYAAWILPFLALSPRPAWFWFTGAVSLSYLKYAWEPSGLPLWVRLVEYVPLYLLLLWEWRFSPSPPAGERAG